MNRLCLCRRRAAALYTPGALVKRTQHAASHFHKYQRSQDMLAYFDGRKHTVIPTCECNFARARALPENMMFEHFPASTTTHLRIKGNILGRLNGYGFTASQYM